MSASGPFRPIAAFGQKTHTTLSQARPVGQATFKVASISGFSVGDPIFTSSAADAEFQYHGAIVTIQPTLNELSVAWGLARERHAGDKFWTPQKAVLFRRGATDRIRRIRNTGTRSEVSRGGQVYTTRSADAFETLELAWTAGAPEDYESWRRFLVDDRHEGVDSFALAYWDFQESGPTNQSKCVQARWTGPELTFEITNGLPHLARFDIQLHIVKWDAYVEA